MAQAHDRHEGHDHAGHDHDHVGHDHDHHGGHGHVHAPASFGKAFALQPDFVSDGSAGVLHDLKIRPKVKGGRMPEETDWAREQS
jgi:hypothetical protein